MEKSLLIWSPSSMTCSPVFSFYCVVLATLCRIFSGVSGNMDFAAELLANLSRFPLHNCSLGELPCQSRLPSPHIWQLYYRFCSLIISCFVPFRTMQINPVHSFKMVTFSEEEAAEKVLPQYRCSSCFLKSCVSCKY